MTLLYQGRTQFPLIIFDFQNLKFLVCRHGKDENIGRPTVMRSSEVAMRIRESFDALVKSTTLGASTLRLAQEGAQLPLPMPQLPPMTASGESPAAVSASQVITGMAPRTSPLIARSPPHEHAELPFKQNNELSKEACPVDSETGKNDVCVFTRKSKEQIHLKSSPPQAQDLYGKGSKLSLRRTQLMREGEPEGIYAQHSLRLESVVAVDGPGSLAAMAAAAGAQAAEVARHSPSSEPEPGPSEQPSDLVLPKVFGCEKCRFSVRGCRRCRNIGAVQDTGSDRHTRRKGSKRKDYDVEPGKVPTVPGVPDNVIQEMISGSWRKNGKCGLCQHCMNPIAKRGCLTQRAIRAAGLAPPPRGPPGSETKDSKILSGTKQRADHGQSSEQYVQKKTEKEKKKKKRRRRVGIDIGHRSYVRDAAAAAAATTTTIVMPTTSNKTSLLDEDGWSREQLDALEKAVGEIPPTMQNKWHAIAKRVPGKSYSECFAKVFSKELAGNEVAHTAVGASEPKLKKKRDLGRQREGYIERILQKKKRMVATTVDRRRSEGDSDEYCWSDSD